MPVDEHEVIYEKIKTDLFDKPQAADVICRAHSASCGISENLKVSFAVSDDDDKIKSTTYASFAISDIQRLNHILIMAGVDVLGGDWSETCAELRKVADMRKGA